MDKLYLTAEEKKILEKLPIEALILFGSQAQGTAGKLNDYDFAVLPSKHLVSDESKQLYDTLYDLLSEKIQQLVNIDIVFLPGASMELQSSAARFGIPLYERSPHTFERFRERVIIAYADFAPLHRMFQKEILSRIP